MNSRFTSIIKKVLFLIIIFISSVYPQTVLFDNLEHAFDPNSFPKMAQQFQTTANLRFIHEVVLNIYEGSESGNFTVSIYNYINDWEIGSSLVTLYSGNKTDLPDNSSSNFTINTGSLPFELTASTKYWIVVTSDAGSVNWNYCDSDEGIGDGFIVNNYYFEPDGEGDVFSFYGPFALKITANNVLPVELNSFTSSVLNNEVILNWQTATEVNNYGFEIERTPLIPPFGKGGRPEEGGWEKIGFVAGSGNSNSKKEYSFTDDLHHTSIQSYNHTFRYRLKQIDNDGTFSYSNIIEAEVTDIPAEFMLYQNYPNPFNPSTVISYQLPVNTFVTLKVFDIIGNEVATLVNQEKPAGSYEVTFDASNLTSGVYFYELRTDNFRSVRKLMLIK